MTTYTAPLTAAQRYELRRRAVAARRNTRGWTDQDFVDFASEEMGSLAPAAAPKAAAVAVRAESTGSPLEAVFAEFVESLALKSIDEDRVVELIHAHAAQPMKIEVHNIAKGEVVVIERAHKAFAKVLRYVRLRRNVYLVGPAGSGKTTLVKQVAQALGKGFKFDGKVTQEHKLTGFIDAGGTYQTTPFREAFDTDSVYLADEIDGWAANPTLWLNAPIANRMASFADGVREAHEGFVFIAAANTYGRGADQQYVGRNTLDASTRDRFVTVEVEYDEELERDLAVAEFQSYGGTDTSLATAWVARVQRIRHAVAVNGVKLVVSPRASIDGAALLADGVPVNEVLTDVVWKGVSEDVRALLGA